MPKAKLYGSQLKDFRKKVARLKAMGLIRKSVDARSQRSTRHMRDTVEKKFKAVLEGRAVAVKLPSRKLAKEYGASFITRGRRVVVPIEKGSSRPHYSRKRKEISGTVKQYGQTFKRIYAVADETRLPKLPNAKSRYVMPFKNGFLTFDHVDDLIAHMTPYEHPPKTSTHHPWKNWRDFVWIDEQNTAQEDDGEE